MESRDENGLLVFHDEIGQLVRVWGPDAISDMQLRQIGLEKTDLTFPAGRFYRRAKKPKRHS
jgi:hypothetical protein